MNTNTQPSEHTMRAAKKYWNDAGEGLEGFSIEMARYIDQHAIAPAVAERDKRIAELENYIYALERNMTIEELRDARAEVRGSTVAELTRECEEQARLLGVGSEREAKLIAQVAEAEASLSALRAECLHLSRENLELKRGAPLERVLSPSDSRVTDYTD